MAKDDYDVIVYRVLVYMYACKKRNELFDKAIFEKTVKRGTNEEYFVDVLHMMHDEGLVTGLTFTKIWGGVYILASDIEDLEITASGIHYIKENSIMCEVGKLLKGNVDVIAALADRVLK